MGPCMMQRTALVRKRSKKGEIYVQIFDTSHGAICGLQTAAFPNKAEEDASALLDHLGLRGLDFA